MALALGLVGQPVQPYLTTGATDYVNSVQKGKEDAIRTEALKQTNQKSALDLLTAQKKAVKEEEVSSTMPELMGRIAKGELTDKQKSDLLQVHPDFAKTYIATNDEKAKEKVNNLMASSLIKLTHSTDANNDAANMMAAFKQHGINLNLPDNATPDELKDALKVAIYGMKAIDQKTKSVDEFGNVVEKNALGEQVGYDRAPVKTAKATPTDKTIDVPLGKDGSYVRYAVNTDGSRTEIGKYNPPAPKAEKTPSGDLVQTANGWEFVPKGQVPKGAPVVKKPEAPSGEESKSAGYAFRMGEANKILTDFESNKKGMPSYAASMAGGVPVIGDYLERKAQDQNEQLYKNAALAWIRAKLRDESGATIQNLESTNEYRTYFPLVGDEPETIKQKAKLREIAEAEMMLKAGKASTKLEEARKNYNAKQPIKIKTREDYNRLKSGDVYIDPNGVKRTKA